jgi:hypothetical protein
MRSPRDFAARLESHHVGQGENNHETHDFENSRLASHASDQRSRLLQIARAQEQKPGRLCYSVTDLGPLAMVFSEATYVTNNGLAGGATILPNGTQHVLWYRTGHRYRHTWLEGRTVKIWGQRKRPDTAQKSPRRPRW